MTQSALNWKVVGAAGEGIKSTGLLFSKACLRSGLYTFDYTDYPSLIRGGHNTYQVYAANHKVYSQEAIVDILVSLNKNGLSMHEEELSPQSLLIADFTDLNLDPQSYSTKAQVLNIPLVQIATSAGGERLMMNNAALGVSMFLFGLPLDPLLAVIADVFASKGDPVIKPNQAVATAGYEYAKTNHSPLSHISVTPQPQVDTISLTGNDAASLGAIAGGMKAYIAYPMTPSSAILHTLAEWADKADILVKHAEDEIGVINMALGASFTGVRVGVGTSGGGFAYMTEAVGFSGVAELPLVIFEAQRPGPALGMPTWTAQADLMFVIFASQDEFPRIVLAPGDVDDAFNQSKLAFELAEQFQLPVIVLTDKHLGESYQSTHIDTTVFSHTQTSINQNPTLDENGFYPRYAITESGVSPRTVPGQPNGFHITNSYETDIYGMASEESQPRIDQMQKRFRKLNLVKQLIPTQHYNGGDHPQLTFITWGSTKLAVEAALPRLQEQGLDVAHFNLSWIWPFPIKQVIDVIQKSTQVCVVEGNYTNQLASLIRQQTGIEIYHKRTRYDGRPFYPHQIEQYAKEILESQ